MGVSLWKQLKIVGDFFKSLTRIEVGDDRKTSFCHDVRCARLPMAVVFPSIYKASRKKSGSVADFINYTKDGTMF